MDERPGVPLAIDADALAGVQSEWLRRTEAEYRSASITHHLTLWLIQVGAPFELIRAGLKIADDELVHSELSHAVHIAAGGSTTPTLERHTLGIQSRSETPLELAIARTGVQVFCLGETVAVRLFSRLRQGCNQTEARAALDRILQDEVTHRDFGWTLLEWLLTTPCEQGIRQLIEAELPSMFTQLKESYAYRALGKPGQRTDLQRTWGTMPPAMYAEALEETFERDYAPRFADLGFEVERHWR